MDSGFDVLKFDCCIGGEEYLIGFFLLWFEGRYFLMFFLEGLSF